MKKVDFPFRNYFLLPRLLPCGGSIYVLIIKEEDNEKFMFFTFSRYNALERFYIASRISSYAIVCNAHNIFALILIKK